MPFDFTKLPKDEQMLVEMALTNAPYTKEMWIQGVVSALMMWDDDDSDVTEDQRAAMVTMLLKACPSEYLTEGYTALTEMRNHD